MVRIRWINKGEQVAPVPIMEAEKRYNAQYVGDMCLTINGSYSDDPVAIFWTANPKPGYSNYFGLFVREYYFGRFMIKSKLIICSGASVAVGEWNG